ncbi:hypothetical protein OAS35_03425 [Pelagibacteraceae bacterium]|nr:hypothetical protein [Pelagibacteraceae bacterium]
MDQKYSIDEILLAVNEIENRRRKKKIKTLNNKTPQKDYSAVPKNTLNLIEEAEKIKN